LYFITFGERWSEIVKDYKGTKLTYDDDMLPALSSLSNLIQVISPGRYLAGIWRADIVYQLGWESVPTKHGCRRTSQYIAPTFSWASRVGGPNFPPNCTISRTCTVVDARCTPSRSDVFGRVSDGYIKLKERMGNIRKIYKLRGRWFGKFSFFKYESRHKMGAGTHEDVAAKEPSCLNCVEELKATNFHETHVWIKFDTREDREEKDEGVAYRFELFEYYGRGEMEDDGKPRITALVLKQSQNKDAL
jgi:hypothetical protein